MSLLKQALDEMNLDFDEEDDTGDPCGADEAGKLVDFHRLSNQQEEEEMEGGKDVVTMDMPFMIRIFELVRENIKTDEDLHHVADKLLDLSRDGRPLTMDDYGEFREFEGEGEEGGEYPEEGEMDVPGPEAEEDCEITSAGPVSVEQLMDFSRKRREYR